MTGYDGGVLGRRIELIEGSNNLNAAVSRKVAKYGLVVED